MPAEPPPVLLGVSLKMYLSSEQTLQWCEEVVKLVGDHPAVTAGEVEVFVLPSFQVLAPVAALLGDTALHLGAQDLFWEDRGPYTGEVSGSDLAGLGCRYVEVGHAERRRIFGEDGPVLAAKARAAVRNGLVPVLCVGETERVDVPTATAACVAQLEEALAGATGPVVVAYEPEWAIGAERAAGADHIGAVCARLKEWLAGRAGLSGSRVIYGGSAGPGLLHELGEATDGLFLGRSVHRPAALLEVVEEAAGAVRGSPG